MSSGRLAEEVELEGVLKPLMVMKGRERASERRVERVCGCMYGCVCVCVCAMWCGVVQMFEGVVQSLLCAKVRRVRWIETEIYR